MEATREQQREARRQKVLARSEGGHRAPVVDLATEQKEIAPQGATAVLDDDDENQAAVDDLLDPAAAAAAAAEDSGKSASRLAAERRRQRILSKSTERMAKVQGDRVIRGGGEEERPAGGEDGGGESLDDMLEAAEAEFFGEGQEGEGAAGVAEAKPAAPHQAYFKSTKGGRGGGLNSDGEGAAGSRAGGAAAQSKPVRQRVGSAGSGFKAPRSEGGAPKRSPTAGRSGTSSRRPTGNKALEKKPFDLAAIQSLSGAAGTGVGSATDPGHKRLFGGVRFWAGLEGITKTALLLLVGAGVGGLLLPEARAAVAQAKFEVEHMQGFADSRSRLELFLAGDGRSGGGERPTTFDVDFDNAGSEFGDVVDVVDDPPAESSEAGIRSELKAKHGPAMERARARGDGEKGEGLKWEEFGDLTDGADDDGMISRGTDWFLGFVDYVAGWAHYLSTVTTPWGSGSEISCISAIYLALLVRFVVATVFSGVRFALALPVFPPAAPTSKPGMIMGMVLASVPTLGKVLAWGNMVKSIFSDTNLVVAGTVLTLAVSLALEEGAGPRRLAGSISGALGLLTSQPANDPTLKEL